MSILSVLLLLQVIAYGHAVSPNLALHKISQTQYPHAKCLVS
jgi:hypothetical protein